MGRIAGVCRTGTTIPVRLHADDAWPSTAPGGVRVLRERTLGSPVAMRLVAIDVVALVVGLTIPFSLRAVLRHPDLLAYRSVSRFVAGSLAFALPMLALAFHALGLYSSTWVDRGRAAVVGA